MNTKTLLRLLIGFAVCLSAGGPLKAAEINIDTTSPFLYPQYSKKISMDFEDAALVDVLKIFSQQTSLNLVTAEEIADKRVTVYLDQVPVEQALEQVLRANNLTYELQPNSDIYIVKPLSKPDADIITRVYQLKHATVGSSKMRQTVRISVGDEDSAEVLEEDTESDSIGLTAAITGILTSRGKIIEDPRTNSLIITDIASNFSNIENAVARLDVSIPQILIEVEMLEVTKETADLIGIKMGDTPLVFTGAQRDHVYPWNQNQLLRKGYTFEDPEYRVGTIDASGLEATLQFLRTQSDTKNLARPRILTLNNEAAQIRISTDEAIGIITQTVSTDGVGSSSVEAERVQTGVFLTVTPQANLLTDEIIMAIAPKVIIARTGSTFGGTTFRDPEERGSQSILRVKSGDTIILGGLLREDSSKTITKLPILGDLPFIGGAFRHKDENITERELIIFITPRIVNEPQMAATALDAKAGFIREQDIPSSRRDKVEKALTAVEKQNL